MGEGVGVLGKKGEWSEGIDIIMGKRPKDKGK